MIKLFNNIQISEFILRQGRHLQSLEIFIEFWLIRFFVGEKFY